MKLSQAKKRIKSLAQLMVVVLLVVMLAQNNLVTGQITFKDVKSDAWYLGDLNYLLEDNRQIIQGYPDGTFKPETKLTVEQFVKALVVACYFTNLTPNAEDWSLPYRTQATTIGILKAGDFDNYKREITREEMAMLAVRTSDYLEKSPEKRDLGKVETLIKDSFSITASKKESVLRAYDMGILLGYPDGKYNPKISLKRSEAVAVIRRVIDVANRKIPDLSKVTVQPTDTIVVEGIKYSVSQDTLHMPENKVYDGCMKMTKAMDFIDLYVNSIRLTKESGKYYISGYLPNLPAGQYWGCQTLIFWKSEKPGVDNYQEYYTNETNSNYNRMYAGQKFKFELKGGPDYLDKMVIGASIVTKAYGWDGKVNVYYPDKEFTINWGRTYEIRPGFNWEALAQW